MKFSCHSIQNGEKKFGICFKSKFWKVNNMFYVFRRETIHIRNISVFLLLHHSEKNYCLKLWRESNALPKYLLQTHQLKYAIAFCYAVCILNIVSNCIWNIVQGVHVVMSFSSNISQGPNLIKYCWSMTRPRHGKFSYLKRNF